MSGNLSYNRILPMPTPLFGVSGSLRIEINKFTRLCRLENRWLFFRDVFISRCEDTKNILQHQIIRYVLFIIGAQRGLLCTQHQPLFFSLSISLNTSSIFATMRFCSARGGRGICIEIKLS